MPLVTAQSTVRANTSGSSPSRPKTKLPLIMMPRSSSRRVTPPVAAAEDSAACRRPAGLKWRAFRSRRTGSAARPRGQLDRVVAQDRVDRRRSLKDAVHAVHAAEEFARESAIAEEMIVEEVEMRPGSRAISASASSTAACRRIARLRRKRPCSRTCSDRTASRDDDEFGPDTRPLDQVAPDRRQGLEVRSARLDSGAAACRRQGPQELREGVLAGPEKIVSACGAASSGSEVTWSPPSTTWRLATIVVGDGMPDRRW